MTEEKPCQGGMVVNFFYLAKSMGNVFFVNALIRDFKGKYKNMVGQQKGYFFDLFIAD